MMDLNEAGFRVIENRKRRGWPSADDLSKTTCGLAEEVGEFETSRKQADGLGMVDALIDVMVFCLGGLTILGRDIEAELQKVLKENESREHTGSH